MRLPLWLIALLFVGYSIWAVRTWSCHMCDCCGEATEQVAQKQTTGVPLFLWNADEPVPDDKFPEWKTNFLKEGGQGDTLVITGWYREGEPNGEALASARAEAIKAKLDPQLPASRVLVTTPKMVDDGLVKDGDPMESAGFEWRKLVLKEEIVTIIESDNDVTFLFPFNSTQRIQDEGVDTYMKTLVEKHKDSKATFVVVGHTDNIGGDASNLKLGQARAEAIASLLKSNGIAADRIEVSSKGESEPVADNATEDGQRQNRRVVLTVNN
jgi:outer membrane protein OmpA-like peptidoglycan-associated protein